MYAVGRLGSYISQGVYTVSGPFHPFGGAVDIIVVEQEDGSFKSSPWYIRFGKFQGVLKSKEKVVSICVEGVDAGFHMLLDNKGEAYFLREADEGEEEKSGLYPLSSVEEIDRQPQKDKWHLKSKSCNFDSFSSKDNPMDMSNVSRAKSGQSRIMGLFGRKPVKEETSCEKQVNNKVIRVNSLERAEMAADLMDLHWSTNKKTNPCNASNVDNKADKDLKTNANGPSSRVNSETCDGNADHDGNANGIISETASPNSKVRNSVGLEQQFLVEQGCNENGLHQDTHTEQPVGDTMLGTELSEHTEDHCQQTYSSRPCTPERNKEYPKNSFTVTGSHSHIHRVDPVHGSVEDEKKFVDERIESSLQSNVVSGGDTKKPNADSLSTEIACDAASQSSEEEQFLFGDLDEDKVNAVHTVERKSPDHKDKENHPSFSLEETEEMHKSVSRSFESYASLDQSSVVSNPIGIPRNSKTPDKGVGRLGESVPNMWFHVEDLNDSSDGRHSLSQSLDASPKSLKLTLLGKDDFNGLHSDAEQEGQLRKELLDVEDAHTSGEPNSASASPRSGRHAFGSKQKGESEDMIAVDRVKKPSEGDHSKPPSAPGGRWRIWPFMFRTTRSVRDNQAPPGYVRIPDSEDAAECAAAESAVESAAESAVESPAESVRRRVAESAPVSPAESVRRRVAESAPVSPGNIDDGENELRPKGVKKMFRALTPTSEQLESLKLSEGKNSITFTFSTGMLGDQQVDARIYLWKWNTRIVISDVDGTITKSDVLGQFMPLVGIDWCQTGVTQLFSAIKENGYQLLFLSARAIAQATTTRQFLLNIKQDGKALPDGPIVISPDGLFPSLFREVIRRAPHEFKIACLEDIKALFPEDSNPFYAGFGNRDTDEISYLKVGIPMGKIFIINPKGEVAVNRRVDRKSYTSLHDLVHRMFPNTEQEQEDFNSWNFWKLPPPSMNM